MDNTAELQLHILLSPLKFEVSRVDCIFLNQLLQKNFPGILSVSNILDPDQVGQNKSENVHSDLESMYPNPELEFSDFDEVKASLAQKTCTLYTFIFAPKDILFNSACWVIVHAIIVDC